MKRLIFILICLTSACIAYGSPFSQLYVSLKNNNICVFTKNTTHYLLSNETLIYMGKIEENIEFTSSYSKTYKNLKMPINEENCLQIPLSHFEIGKPYEIWLETHEEYKQRICLSKSSNQIQLVEVIDGYTCGKEQYDYSGSNIFEKLQIF